jgi:peptide deformylase
MEVVKAPSPKLRVKTKPVKKITPDHLKIAREMIKLTEAFVDPEGVGLATTQIGREDRFFIGKLGPKFVSVFNPKILSFNKKTKAFFEGCLSIPDLYGYVNRPTAITVEYQNEKGQKVSKMLRGLAAWVFQHETDHLNGILFVDRVLEQKGRFFKVVGKDKTGADVFEEVELV